MVKNFVWALCFISGLSGATECPPGEGVNDAGVCVTCSAGFYQPKADGGVCEPCAPGTSSIFPGATECDWCPAGSAQPMAGQLFCALCQPGFFSSSSGSIACLPCPDATFSFEGSIGCESCPPPQAAPDDCVRAICFAGTVVSEWDDTEIPPSDFNACTRDVCREGAAVYLPDESLCDAGTVDAGVSDAGTVDAGGGDGGASDAGPSDTVSPPASVADAGSSTPAPVSERPVDGGLATAEPTPPSGCRCGATASEAPLGMMMLMGAAWLTLRARRKA